MQMSLLIGLVLFLAATQVKAASTREQGVHEHADVTSSTVGPAIGSSPSPANRTQIGQAGNDVTKTIKSKKSDAGFQSGNNHAEEFRQFSGVRYTPLDLAEYILRTGDEEGVALAIEELLSEGLMNRDEAILYLETVKQELQKLRARYEQSTKKATVTPHRVPQLRVQPHPAYEAKHKSAEPKRSEADVQRVQTPHSLFREQQEQEQLQQQQQLQLRQQQRTKQLEKMQQEQIQMLQQEQEQELQQEERRQQQRFQQLQQQEEQRQKQEEQRQKQEEQRQKQEEQRQQQRLQQEQQQRQLEDQQEQKQQLPMQLAKLVKVKAEKQQQIQQQQKQDMKLNLLTSNKTPKQPAKVYNGTELKQTTLEQQQQQQPHEQPILEQTQNPTGKYDDHLLENVIYQLAKDMFSQSMIRDNASAEQLLSRFASFLEGELADKRFSKEAQNKIMDTVSAALVESLRERLYLEN